MSWSRRVGQAGASAASAAAHHPWIAVALLLGPVVTVGVFAVILVTLVPSDKRAEAVAAVVPALIAAVGARAKKHRAEPAKDEAAQKKQLPKP